MENVLKMEKYKRNHEKQKLSKLLKSVDTPCAVPLSSTAAFTTLHKR